LKEKRRKKQGVSLKHHKNPWWNMSKKD